MKARDVVGRTIVGVRQERVATRATWDLSGQEKVSDYVWEVTGFELDNGTVVVLHAIETDDSPAVTVSVVRRKRA